MASEATYRKRLNAIVERITKDPGCWKQNSNDRCVGAHATIDSGERLITFVAPDPTPVTTYINTNWGAIIACTTTATSYVMDRSAEANHILVHGRKWLGLSLELAMYLFAPTRTLPEIVSFANRKNFDTLPT